MEPRHQHLDRADRVAEHCAGRCRCNDLAILFEDDPDGAQVDIQGAPRPSAHDEPRRGTVVGDDTDQIELELLEPAVDDLDRGLNEVSPRDYYFELIGKSS